MSEQIDPFTVKKVECLLNGYIALKVPGHVRSSVRLTYMIRDNRLTLTEERPSYDSEQWECVDIAQFRWEQNYWNVYARQENDRWRSVEQISPDSNFESQLERVEIDSEGIFWTG